jgi:putative tricarboxylic transport membrane protein
MRNELRRRFASSPDLPERCTAALFAVLALAAFIMALDLGFYRNTQPGPGLFPALISALLLVLSVLWFIQGAQMPPDEAFARAEEIALEGSGLTGEDLASQEPKETSVAVLVFSVLWALVPILFLTVAGFAVSMTVYVSGMLLFVGKTSRLWTIPLAFVGTVAVAIGAHALGIYLPEPINYFRWLGL